MNSPTHKPTRHPTSAALPVPGRRVLPITLVLLFTLLAVSCAALGIFRLAFDGNWTRGVSESGELFYLTVRGLSLFDPFAGEPFGRVFWGARLLTLALALALPWLRVVPGAVLSLAVAVVIVWLHYGLDDASPRMPAEFDLLLVGLLLAIRALLGWAAELSDRRRFSRLLGQYVSPELAAQYSRHPDSMGLAGEAREVSVLFCDIVGFAAVSEALGPAGIPEWLNGFFECVSRVVVRHRGTIDKLMGDSVMAVWGAPARSATHAFDALSAALDMQRELEILNERYLDRGLPGLTAGIGLSTGRVNVGPLGSAYRMDYTVVGDTVNVAQRIEKQTRKYRVPIIVSDRTAEALPDVLFRELDTVQVKGREKPVTMYSPLGPRSEIDEQTLAWLELHREAMAASKRGDWEEARAAFEQLAAEWGPADMYALYLRGIEQVAPRD